MNGFFKVDKAKQCDNYSVLSTLKSRKVKAKSHTFTFNSSFSFVMD